MGPIQSAVARRIAGVLLSLALLTALLPAQETPKISLDTNEALFATLTAINMCGFDLDLDASDPIRSTVRNDLAERLRASSAADLARDQMCQYYRDKKSADAGRDLAQYISLALHVKSVPEFDLKVKEADLPPDASNLVGFLPLLKKFYEATNLHSVWTQLQPKYEGRIAQLQEPVAQLIQSTDFYLKMPISGYLGRRFVVYVEPMGASSQVNARNYGVDYFLVASPGPGWLKTDQIRHTYLHFILDPLVLKRANQLQRLEPLLELAKTAPLEDSYKNDAGLMVVESLIRAIEARTMQVPKNIAADDPKVQAQLADCGLKLPEKNLNLPQLLRDCSALSSMKQGYILTSHFYDQLRVFEEDPTGLRDAFGDMMVKIDLGRERKRIGEIQFSREASPEVISASKQRKPESLDLAEERLAQRDVEGAQRIAREVLEQKTGDQARAMFILGRAATLSKDIPGARMLFERTLEVAREPRMVAWSHIYLARILDLMCNREMALSHYKAAMQAGDTAADTKAAADRGVQELPPGCEKED